MATLTQTYGAGEPLTYDVPFYSRDEIVVLSGQDLAANTVLGKTTLSAAIAVAYAGNTGNGTMGAVTIGKDAMPGAYKLTISTPGANVGNFILQAPDGSLVGQGDVATAFASNHLSFTLADGGTDFVAGDGFTIYTNAVAGTVTGTGNGTLAVVAYDSHAMPGAYTLTCTAAATDAGTFSVVGPDGVSLGSATVAVEFRGGGLTFTIADGSTDFIVGDTIAFTIAAGKMKAWNPTNTDGSAKVAGILLYAVDATDSDLPGTAIVRHASVNPAELSYYTGATEGAKRNALGQLAALGIVTR